MNKLDRNEMIDLLTGCALFGTGGGGEFDAGMSYVDLAFEAGKEFQLVSLNELSEDSLFCSPYALGCTLPSPRPPSQQHLPTTDEPPILSAVNALSGRLGQNFAGAISCELGAENTAVAAYAAAITDGCLLDGDAAGRAVPEITHSTFYLNRLPVAPMVMANHFGETVICENVFDDRRAEEIARGFAKISCDDIVAVDHPLTIAQLGKSIIEGSLSRALDIGKLLNNKSLLIEEACDQIIANCHGRLLFRGEVSSVEDHVNDGFTMGQITIQGNDLFRDRQCTIEFKNENMLARVDSEVVVTIPELICVVDNRTRCPVTNPNAKVGDCLTAFVLPAPKPFTTPAGLEIFGPAYLGINIPFRPFCAGH